MDGLDEITVSAKNLGRRSRKRQSQIILKFRPKNSDLKKFRLKNLENIRGGNAEQNAKIIRQILEGKRKDAARNLVLLNAAAAIFVGGKAENLEEAVETCERKFGKRKGFGEIGKFDRNKQSQKHKRSGNV